MPLCSSIYHLSRMYIVRLRSNIQAQTVLKHRGATRVSEVYESYWRFAAERQTIFFKRASGQDPPWTEDHVLATYKFTNAYRASDRVSQYLIRNVIYRERFTQHGARSVFSHPVVQIV